MPAAELTEWIAFSQMEPFGGQVDDIRAALPSVMLINNLRRMFDGEAKLLEMHDVVPWMAKPQPVVLHQPEAPEYDAEKHAEALRALFSFAGNDTRH